MVETQIGHFQVLEEIGAGGMGTVYRGVDTLTDSPVAVKRLKPELVASSPDIIDRFIREGEALRQLDHHNIVKMLDALQVGNEHYLVMEFVSGGSLADLLRTEQTLSVSRTLDIALELADALTRAHHLKIIHRDIKPANVLIADDGTPRLTDFGVAHMGKAERITELGAAVGTLHYLSPEALNGEDVDPRTDLWAFGVMLFEMLVGELPFDADSWGGIVTSILTQLTPDLETLRPDIPVTVVDLIYRMLEKDRQTRIPSARLVGAELEAILQGRDMPSNGARVYRDAPLQSVFDTLLLAPSDTPKHNLPLQITPFVGREEEVTELVKLLDNLETRLVTILAPGGMGKTRLALEVGTQFVYRNTLHQRRSFTNGVYFVALAPLTAPDFIVSAIADAVGFQFYQGGEPTQQLLDYFREKNLLLLTDNFEHLLEGAGIVGDILAYAPGVKVLATSRERLNLGGETIFALSGMDFPDWKTPEDALDYAAVKLFMQSARRIRPDFELAAEDLNYLAHICDLVAGMPLGIVLAAAWVDMLSLKEIADEIEQSLDFLETEMRDVPERQRSVRGVLEYSWKRLSDDERNVFMKLSVFRGGFTRQAGQAVAGASLKTLAALVSKSLLRRNPSGRYQVHELLRQYGEQRLREASDEHDMTRDLHAAYFAEFLHQKWDELKSYHQREALAEIEIEFDNIRTAWMVMVEKHQAVEIYKSTASLYRFLNLRDRPQEGVDFFGQAVESLLQFSQDRVSGITFGLVLAQQGWFYVSAGFPEKGKFLAEEGLAILERFDSQEDMMVALQSLVFATAQLNQWGESKRAAEEGLRIARNLDDQWWVARFLHRAGQSARELHEYAEALQMAKEGLEIAEQFGDPWMLYACKFLISRVAYNMGDQKAAKRWMKQALIISEEIGQARGIALTYGAFGDIAMSLKDFTQAKRYYQQRLKVFAESGQQTWETAATLLIIARLLIVQNQREQAIELLAVILHAPSSLKTARDEVENLLAQLQNEIGSEAYAAAWERGKTLDLNTVVAELISEMEPS